MAELSVLGEQVVEELGGRFGAGHQEMIAGTGAGDVEQMALGGVDLVEFGLIADSLDSCLRRQRLVIAGGDDHGAKLQTLGEVHRTDCDLARDAACVLRQIDRRMTCRFNRRDGSVQFGLRSDEHAHLVRGAPFLPAGLQPLRDCCSLRVMRGEHLNHRFRAIEYGDGAGSPVGDAVHV